MASPSKTRSSARSRRSFAKRFGIGLLILGLLAVCPTTARELHGFQPIGPSLSHKTVHTLLQDSDSYIWVGTLDGLNRFDGYQFITWRHDANNNASLSSSVIYSLLEDQGGDLWVGTGNGLNRINRASGSVERDQIKSHTGESPGVVNALVEANGLLWAGTETGLFVYRDDHWRLLDLSDGNTINSARPRIGSLAAHEHRVYALVHQEDPPVTALLGIADGGTERQVLEFKPNQDWVHAIGVSRQGAVWVNTGGPIGELGSVQDLSQLDGQQLWSFAEGREGQVWLGTVSGLLDGSDPDRAPYLMNPSPRAYLSNFVRSVLVDNAGELWIGTYDGLYRSLPSYRPFRYLAHTPDNENSLSTAAVASVFEDASGQLWVGTFGGGVNRIHADGTVDQFVSLGADGDRMENVVAWDLGGATNGMLLIGTPSGLYQLNTENGESHRLPVVDAKGSWPNVRQIRSGAGRTWLGTTSGLIEYLPDTRHEQVWPQANSELTDWRVESMEVDGQIVWLGTTGRTLVRFDSANGATDHFTLPSDYGGAGIWDLHIRGNGSVLLGTSGGLMILDDQGQLTAFADSRDLPGNVVYGILEDSHDNLWLGTNQGLVRVNANTGAVRVYQTADGTGNHEYNRHAALLLSGGDLAFGGMNGLTRFDPLNIGENDRPPPIVITQIEVHTSDRVHRLTSRELLQLNHSDYTFAVEFAALDYADPGRNQYRYRLRGFDRNWIEAGTRRRATYTNIPSGEYRLEIQGSNNDGVWNRQGAALAIHIAPPYWKTWWFRLLIASVVMALVAMIYRLRVAHLLRLEQLRVQIAGDLHDEIGSDLSGIAIASDVVRRELQPGSSGQEQLREISSVARRTANNLRDIVWYINPQNDRGLSLRLRMQATAQSMLAELDYLLEFDDAADGLILDMELRRNIHLVFKEALNNIYHHARASSVVIRGRCVDGFFELEIRDDGQGFDLGEAQSGTGLSSMQHRMVEIGGELQISSTGEGTRIQVLVPLPKTRDGHGGRFGVRL